MYNSKYEGPLLLSIYNISCITCTFCCPLVCFDAMVIIITVKNKTPQRYIHGNREEIIVWFSCYLCEEKKTFWGLSWRFRSFECIKFRIWVTVFSWCSTHHYMCCRAMNLKGSWLTVHSCVTSCSLNSVCLLYWKLFEDCVSSTAACVCLVCYSWEFSDKAQVCLYRMTLGCVCVMCHKIATCPHNSIQFT